ncbi:MAG: LysM peptidoglycan-binding domain-containing protein, partial [Kangiellaceae bacterium]
MSVSTKVSLFFFICCLAACSNHLPAPVDDLRYSLNHKTSRNSDKAYSQQGSKYQSELNKVSQHKVAPGETLFAIAWRYSLDYHTIA